MPDGDGGSRFRPYGDRHTTGVGVTDTDTAAPIPLTPAHRHGRTDTDDIKEL